MLPVLPKYTTSYIHMVQYGLYVTRQQYFNGHCLVQQKLVLAIILVILFILIIYPYLAIVRSFTEREVDARYILTLDTTDRDTDTDTARTDAHAMTCYDDAH